jgi:Methionine biosynthesis protein MetW
VKKDATTNLLLIKRIINRTRSAGRRSVAWSRRCAAACVTLLVRTHVHRWRKVAAAGTPHWDGRNVLIAGFIPDGSSVLDLGCGPQTLRKHLKPGCRYQPCDIIKSSPDVILCDFNGGVYPAIKEHFDYVVCSGVFEYIRRPKEFLEKNSTYATTMILTFNPLLPNQSKLHRLSVNWINHLTKVELENMFRKAGLKSTALHIKEDGETIYSLSVADQNGNQK